MTERREIEREYQAKSISAHPDWWKEVESTAQEMGLNRSAIIRMAVNEYLKGGGKRQNSEDMATAA